jgi:hypothetical protein
VFALYPDGFGRLDFDDAETALFLLSSDLAHAYRPVRRDNVEEFGVSEVGLKRRDSGVQRRLRRLWLCRYHQGLSLWPFSGCNLPGIPEVGKLSADLASAEQGLDMRLDLAPVHCQRFVEWTVAGLSDSGTQCTRKN